MLYTLSLEEVLGWIVQEVGLHTGSPLSALFSDFGESFAKIHLT